MNLLKNILFVTYIKNKGVRRICFVMGVFFALWAFHITDQNFFYTLLWFYVPFLISATIRWIIVGFVKNKELQEVKTQRQEIREKLEIKKFVLKLLSICVFFAGFWGVQYLVKYIDEYGKIPSNELGLVVGVLYRHEHVYKDICSSNGYELTQYPMKFKEKFSKEINIIEAEAKRRNLPISKLYDYLRKKDSAIRLAAETELESILKMAILEYKAEETKDPNIVWKDEFNNLVNMKKACEIFDNLTEVLLNGEGEGYIVIKKVASNIQNQK